MSSAPLHLLTAGILATSTLLEAQQPERAVFLVRLGRDTIAVENASILNGRFEGDLRYRTPLVRVLRTISVSPANELRRLDITIGGGPRGDSAQVHSVFTVSGDSIEVRPDALPAGSARPLRVFMPRGAVPFNTLSGLTLELILRTRHLVGAAPLRDRSRLSHLNVAASLSLHRA